MCNILKSFTSIILFLILVNSANAQLSGNINVGAGQTYTSLTGTGAAGFFNAVNTVGLSNNVTVYITSDITESGTVNLNQWAVGSAFTITVRPSTAGLYTLLSSDTGCAFTLNGADNVTFDGRFNGAGTGRYLRFSNSSTAGNTFRFINDATGNTINYCIIEGTSASSTEGVIEFTTTTGANGNDNNTISNCYIRDYVGTTPQNLIYSSGSNTSTSTHNSGNTISNNEISNFYVNGQVSNGIYIAANSTDWTITGNSFYQSATRSPGSATTFDCIYINTNTANNMTISSNYFGGTAANCGGSAFTISGGSSNALYMIRLGTSGTTTASNIQGNTIQNINFTTNPNTASVIYFAGILVQAGLVNIGTTSGNTIGNTSANGNIVLTYNGTTDNCINRGIEHRGTGNISNNTVGSVNIGGSNNNIIRFECIYYSGTPSANVTISNNTVGSTTVSNSIQQVTTNGDMQFTGINSRISGVTANITSNTISNLTVTSNSTNARMRGIYQERSTTAAPNISSNLIQYLSCAGSETNRFPDNTMMVGIFSGSNSTSQVVAGNTIQGLYGTGNFDSYVQGFAFYNSAGVGIFRQNKIYNLNHTSTSGAPKIWGVNAFWGSWSYYNNQVSITNGEATDNMNIPLTRYLPETTIKVVVLPQHITESLVFDAALEDNSVKDEDKIDLQTDASTNAAEVKGIHDEAEFGGTYYYNSVYVGGSAGSGSARSWAWDRPLTSWPTPIIMRNNIFFNARTGGTGNHYAIGNEIGSTNWTATSSNYNVFISPNLSTMGVWDSTVKSISEWRTTSLGDKHTWNTTSAVITPGNLFQSVSTGDLRINSGNAAAWIVSGKGIAVTGQSTDYEGNSRPTTVSGGVSDIGIDEFAATPPGNPLATQDVSPGSGNTSNYTLWGRVLATINWGTGGSSYPTSMNVNYYSGVNPLNVVGGNYTNSYWSITPSGSSLTGATYDVTINFGDNEIYTITSPSVNTRLAKYSTSFWYVYVTAGTGNGETELNYSNLWAKTRGLNTFSDYALTDGTNPLPVEICSFTAAVTRRDVRLDWSTCSETNNRGFEIERREFNPTTGEYYPWIKQGFVDGNGTTNEMHYYTFNDLKLKTGKYQYRLKQIDFNSNFEYHNLNTPTDIIIGAPQNADLFQNYPNPSNPTSKVDFQIPFAGQVSLRVFDITGQEVAVLANSQMDAGYYTAEFNGSSLASGVYFYRLIASSTNGQSFTKTMKLILVK